MRMVSTTLPPGARPLTKTEFQTGLRCHKALWWTVHDPLCQELVPDANAKARMQMGRDVGTVARSYVPGGVLIGPAYQGTAARAEATRQAMADGASVIYEATFQAGDLAVSADILQRDGVDGWVLIEVKGSSSVKQHYVADAAFQAHVIRRNGIDLRGVEIMHLNRECRHPELDVLFVREDVTPAAAALEAQLGLDAAEMIAMLAGESPEKDIGKHCIDPDDCPFKGRCWPQFPEHHVSTVYYGRTAWFSWVREGYHTIHDFPDGFKVPRGGKPAARQLRAVRGGQTIVEDGLRQALEALRPPLAFLDFETVMPAIPVWPGCSPLQQLAVQFSCHVEDGNGGHAHHEWLADGPADPRSELAARILAACRGAGSVVAYNASFEQGCLERLADAVPERRDELLDVIARLVDLLPIVRDHIYHAGFRGSFSLKRVLPALAGSDAYAELAVAEGMTASNELTRLLFHADTMVAQERALMREALLAYCKADTWEMVRLLDALRRLAM